MIPIEVIYFVPTIIIAYFVIGLCVKCSKGSSSCFYSSSDEASTAVVLTATNGLNNSTAVISNETAIKDGLLHTNGRNGVNCMTESPLNGINVVTNALTLGNPLISPSPASNRSSCNGYIHGPPIAACTPTPPVVTASNQNDIGSSRMNVDVNDLLNNGASGVSDHSEDTSKGEISYNKISVREPLSRVLAEQAVLEHTYIEVENGSSSGLVEDPGYEIVKTESEPGYEEIGSQSSHRDRCNISNGNLADVNLSNVCSNSAAGMSARTLNSSPNVNHRVTDRIIASSDNNDDEYDDESLYHTYERPEAVYSDPISSDPGYEAVRDWNHPSTPAHINVCNSPTNSTDGLCADHAYAVIHKSSNKTPSHHHHHHHHHHNPLAHRQCPPAPPSTAPPSTAPPPPVSKTITVVRVNDSPATSSRVPAFINSPDSSDSSTINDHAYAVIKKHPTASVSGGTNVTLTSSSIVSTAGTAAASSSGASASTATATTTESSNVPLARSVRLITPSNSLSDSSDDLSTDHVYAVINKPSSSSSSTTAGVSTSTTISTFNTSTGTTITSTIVSSTSPIITTVTLNSSAPPPPPPPPLPHPMQPHQPPPLPPLTPNMTHLNSQSIQKSPTQKRIVSRGKRV